MDILINKRRNRLYAVGITDVGRNWLFDNIKLDTMEPAFTLSISTDVELEFTEALKKAGLDVEFK